MWRFASCSDMLRVLTSMARGARWRSWPLTALVCGGVLTSRPATAQPTLPVPSLPRRATTSEWGSPEAVRTPGVVPLGAPTDDGTVGRVSPWFAPPLSAVVPGLGQGLLRQQRGIVYLAAEGYLILRVIGAERDARRERDAYREIARTVARAGFGADRPDAAWEYYERLQHILESGAFNRTPGATLTPESDPATFNGAMWRLARETFWRDPDVSPDPSSAEYQRAVAFYERRAVGDSFRWSWRDAQLEQDLYRQTIDRSNDASREARQLVGLLLANHALSLVDAYVSVRLRVFGDAARASRRVGVSGELPLPARRR